MNSHTRRSSWTWASLMLGLSLTASAIAQTTQPASAGGAAPSDSYVGVVTGDNVYVRSGGERNYYPVTKLNRGDRVTVVGKNDYGWLKILPPENVWSVIDKNYVDRVDERTGITNGATWALAAGELSKRHYAKQVMLEKGHKVTILGETDGKDFYRIVSPPGAAVWISGDYVADGAVAAAVTREETVEVETVPPGELDLDTAPPAAEPQATTTRPTVAQRPRPEPQDEPNDLPEVPGLEATSDESATLKRIEAEIQAEWAKPVADRVLEPIIGQLSALASETESEATRLYAEARIRQLQNHVNLAASLNELRQMRERTLTEIEELQRKRAEIRAKGATPRDDIAIRGEIRVSGVYNGSGARPKRWRIIDPKGESDQTLAYIEVPPGSPIDPVQYYGKYVGIKASGYELLRNTTPVVPIYTVEEIRVLDPDEQSRSRKGAGAGFSASPAPREVGAPRSQPARTGGGAGE